MSYAQDLGYTPRSFAEIMDALRLALNAEFTMTYTAESFVGSYWYRYFYGAVQQISSSEVKTSEIFAKLSEYVATTNLRIQRPSTSLPGIIDSFAANGWVASVRKNAVEDAGMIGVCVDVDDGGDTYAADRLEINTFLNTFIGAGMVFDGTEEDSITLTNGQEFDFSFHLPTYIPALLKLTLTSSDNQDFVIPSDEVIRQAVFDNTNARYRLGWDFEPQRYYTQVDAPWAATIKLEWSVNAGANWFTTVFEADFDDLYTFDLEDITVLVDP